MLLVAVAALAATAGGSQLALPAVNAVNVDPKAAAFLAEHLAHELKAQGVTVITSREISSLLGMERQRELLGCATEANSCAANLANALGVEGVVLVSLAKLGESIRSSVEVISARDGRTLSSCAAKSRDEDAVADSLSSCAKQLASDLQRALHPEASASSGLRSLAWIPVGLGAAAAGAGIVLFAISSASYSTLRSPHDPPLAADDSIALRDSGKRNSALGIGLISGGAVLVVAGVALLVLLPRSPTLALVPLPGGAAFAFTGAWP